ncbi:stage V sporulation protein AD [Alkalicoccobacillus murimartini]|uniref:Stage V sporulation protein AD n=1 Tax=Alkalicoccobacillus murimartini TaxID=171685 RepID=A0ABT9YDQ8_9BACI|nr:stage V sporulation protein AD [Alkalicoccobacillus murimartini]MDQ0205854.1 stage V sporulation protein AD [Alkalicoccobacillus murimartini]
MLIGQQSWIFETKPVIRSTATIGGPFEAKGRLTDEFDLLHDNLWMGQDSYEKAQTVLIEQACETAIQKGGLKKEQIQFMLSGDLVNQLTPSTFAGRSLKIPYLGLFGACSTSMEGLAMAAYLVHTKGANHVVAVASSHNAATEKQFRYPTEYGGQKPPTSQWTVTAAGAAVVSNEGNGPRVTSATIGRIIDMGLSDPFNMGAAMAPAAVDTLEAHFRDTKTSPEDYDLIVSGDLGEIGLAIAKELCEQKGIKLKENQFKDCGLMIYREGQPVLAGASGPGCSAVVTYGHLLNRMKQGELNRILVIATGALLSPLSFQQKESIPCIAHAVSIEAAEVRV